MFKSLILFFMSQFRVRPAGKSNDQALLSSKKFPGAVKYVSLYGAW